MFRRLLSVLILTFAIPSLATEAAAKELHKAARKGDLDTVQTLIGAGVDLNALDGTVGAPLHWAAARGHLDVAQALLAGGATLDLAAGPPDLLTPLHLAAANGHLPIVALFLEQGADLAAGSEGTPTPLHLAASGDHAGTVAALLEAGADPFAEASGTLGIYPFHWAAQTKGTEVLAVFLEHGFPVDAAMTDGTTAFHVAAFQGHEAVARALLVAGADPDAVSSHYTTPRILIRDQDKMQAFFAELPPE